MDKFGRVSSPVNNNFFKAPFIETPQGNIDFRRRRLENIDLPEFAFDAATKGCVDIVDEKIHSLKNEISAETSLINVTAAKQTEIISIKLDALTVKLNELGHEVKLLSERIQAVDSRQFEISKAIKIGGVHEFGTFALES